MKARKSFQIFPGNVILAWFFLKDRFQTRQVLYRNRDTSYVGKNCHRMKHKLAHICGKGEAR